ncbi:MAG TPA: extracellular solute-binding protein [Actinomycetota bacterium]|nr:extracellular solute-binding protein [Actinomycetota bacterium]
MRARWMLPLVAAVAVVSLGACSSRDALTIYSGRDEALIGPLLDDFSEANDIPIDVRYGDSADLALLIEQEGEGTPADVFLSQSPGPVGFLSGQGVLGELPDDVLTEVDPRFEQSNGEWIGLTARQRVLVYNEGLVDEADLPDSVLDLTDPRYRGDVGVAPTNGSFQDFVTAMRQLEGEEVAQEWLEGMAANDSPAYPDNNSIVDAVARGEIPLGLANHYYNYRFLTEDASLPSRNYQFPDGDVGSVLLATTASVLAASDRREEGERFIRFLLSADAQDYFAGATFEYPLAEGAEPSSAVLPLDELSFPDYDVQELGGGLRRTVEMIAESGLL